MASMEPAGTVPAYDLLIGIRGTEPLIWRRLHVTETITVPELHSAIQVAFGWENRHLYAITAVDRHGSSRSIIGPDEAAEDTDAEPASGVVLFELLDTRGSGPAKLEYEYDFGDSWTHEVEVLGEVSVPACTMICVDGANRGPVEDAGGIGGYRRLIEVLADPDHHDHKEMAAWYKFATGDDAGTFNPSFVDLADINGQLHALSQKLWPEPPSDAEISAVLRPVQWLLNQVPAAGLELTKDGYLKPAVVRQTMDELGWEYRWPGKLNREVQTLPVLRLREQLQAWKLIRKLKGRLHLTPSARKMHDGGRALWDYIAGQVAFPKEDAMRLVTALVVQWMIDGSTPSGDRRERIIADSLERAGFRMSSGRFIPLDLAQDLYLDIRWTLECLDLVHPEPHWTKPPVLTDGGLKFLVQVQSLLGD
jgi:hypothetical protein